MNVTGVVLAVWTLAVVAVIGYRVGYLRGQAELLERGRLTAAEWNALRLKSVLPRWCRVAGWVAYMFSALLLCLFLALAYRYARGWGWTYLMAAWILWFAIFLGGIGLAEWCWKPRAAERPRPAPVRRILYDRRHLRPQEPRADWPNHEGEHDGQAHVVGEEAQQGTQWERIQRRPADPCHAPGDLKPSSPTCPSTRAPWSSGSTTSCGSYTGTGQRGT